MSEPYQGLAQANRQGTLYLAFLAKSTNDTSRSAPGTEFIAPCPIKDEDSQLFHPSELSPFPFPCL
jgi:hypothetical protein